jgi:uncharacterized protein (UPF0332 family)
MSLEDLLREGAIRRIEPDASQAGGALSRARRDVDTARGLIERGDLDWALAVAYNAMLTAGRGLMAFNGYRPSSTEGHFAVYRYLEVVLDGERLVTVFNSLRKKRHRIVYDEMDVVSGDEARRAVEWAEEFVRLIEALIKK